MLLRKRVYEILEINNPRDHQAFLINGGIIGLIIVNVMAVMLDTVRGLSPNAQTVLKVIEVLSLVVYTTEYLVRLW